MAHFEDETVDLTGGLQFMDPLGLQQAAQHAVVTLEQLGKEHRMLGFLDDKGPELGNDQALVRLEILRYDTNEHD